MTFEYVRYVVEWGGTTDWFHDCEFGTEAEARHFAENQTYPTRVVKVRGEIMEEPK